MMGSPSHLLLSVVAGRAAQRNRTLRWGNNVPPFSIGRGGDWCVSAPGVADAHLLLAFDGTRLRVASVSPRSQVRVHGAALPPSWTELTLPAEIQFGEARLRARTVFPASTNLATTQHVDLHALAPLLLASRPSATPLGARAAAANPSTVETVCDGGALRAQALRLQAEAAQQASGWRTALTTHMMAALRWLRPLTSTFRNGVLGQASLNVRRLGLAALALGAALVLAWRLVRSPSLPEPAISAEAPAHEPAAAAPPLAVETAEAATTNGPLNPLPELPPPSPALQRDAFRAALNGDERATDLYQRLATEPDARTFQLAARLSAGGHIRRP
jgi:hypothetical protein